MTALHLGQDVLGLRGPRAARRPVGSGAVQDQEREEQMHRSRLSRRPDTPGGVQRSVLVGRTGRPGPQSPGEPQFTTLYGAIPGLVTAVQSVDDEARYHVDIETDDVAAEVARLQGLGAVEESSWQGCHTLRVPGGHLLCVIPVHTEPKTFGDLAQTWP